MVTSMEDSDRIGWLGKAWIAGVFAYAVLRAAIVWPTLGEYGVSPVIFLIIDVGTAWPYAYGQVRVIQSARAKDWPRVQLWAIVTLISFIAPYLYIAGAGSGEMPLLAWIVIGALMVLLGVASLIRIVRQIRAPEPASNPQE